MNEQTSPAAGTPSDQPMIRLEELTKRYPGQAEPAVDRISMDVPEGEIVILVGPSGCGKTTTLKMINRIIEPTSGRIILENEDVTTVNPDRLRRRIGYVIQQIGLFPHMTIAANIGLVPKLLGWDRSRVAARVDELLDLVGMDPAEFRSRYPKELSGGQRQRVGVARAMGADPPVMLMDEPFGAIDPITRERLQNEFLRLQEEIRKTIVFVTHDIDEAVKMGDRIAILQQGSHIAQYDTPERILTHPANDFVRSFVGSGAAIKRLTLTTVGEVEPASWPTADTRSDTDEVRRRLDGQAWLLLLDERRRPLRWLDADRLRSDPGSLDAAGLPVRAVVGGETTLQEALDEMLTSQVGCAVVVDEAGGYRGVIDLSTLLGVVQGSANGAASSGDETP